MVIYSPSLFILTISLSHYFAKDVTTKPLKRLTLLLSPICLPVSLFCPASLFFVIFALFLSSHSSKPVFGFLFTPFSYFITLSLFKHLFSRCEHASLYVHEL